MVFDCQVILSDHSLEQLSQFLIVSLDFLLPLDFKLGRDGIDPLTNSGEGFVVLLDEVEQVLSVLLLDGRVLEGSVLLEVRVGCSLDVLAVVVFDVGEALLQVFVHFLLFVHLCVNVLLSVSKLSNRVYLGLCHGLRLLKFSHDFFGS